MYNRTYPLMIICTIVAFICCLSFFSFRFGWHFEMFGIWFNLTYAFALMLVFAIIIAFCTVKRSGKGFRIVCHVLTALMVAANGVFFYRHGGDLGIHRRMFMDTLWMLAPVIIVLIAVSLPWHRLIRPMLTKILLVTAVALISVGTRYTLRPLRMSAPPAVFEYGDYYMVVWVTNANGVGWLEVDGEIIYAALHGKNHANTRIHQVQVPKEQLTGAVYTANTRRLLFQSSNKVIFGGTVQSDAITFEGYQGQDEIRILSLADYHGMPRAAERVAAYAGDFDLLVLNGGLLSFIADAREVELSIIAPAGRITGGRVPIIFARGSHEMMSFGTAYLDKYIPLPQGQYYFTFSFGPLFGIVLDAGLDKPDDHHIYGGLSASAAYRARQTSWLENLRDDAPFEGYEHLVVISHVYLDAGSITYWYTMRDWLHIMQDMPICVSIHGHTLMHGVRPPTSTRAFPLIESGGKTDHIGFRHTGALVTIGESLQVTFINDRGETVGHEILR